MTLKVTIEEAEAVLAQHVRPAAQSHAGDIHVVCVSAEGDITVEFSGACRSCPLQPVTFGTSVLPAFEGIPGVRSVRCDSVRVSPHAMKRMAAMFTRSVSSAR